MGGDGENLMGELWERGLLTGDFALLSVLRQGGGSIETIQSPR
jgi:hypothetical protein